MKEKFFEKYADEIEELSQRNGEAIRLTGRSFSRWEMAAVCATPFISQSNLLIRLSRNAPRFRSFRLMNDTATMTAVGNDIDFSRVFVNQLRLLGQPGDMALAVSTSGKSPNLIYALEEARKKQMLTIAWGGKDGGRFPELADYCFIVPSYSIHRIQEVHATLVHVLWDLIHIALGAGRCDLNDEARMTNDELRA